VISAKLPSPLVELNDDRLTRCGLRLWLKRDDLIHPDLPGNKWRKLNLNLIEAREQGKHTLLTFGGAFSNHIRATAAAGRLFGFDTIGIIRGEQHLPLNPVLDYAARQGMRLVYLDRATYRVKHTLTDRLRLEFGDFYLLPEGGSNALAARGCALLPGEIDIDFDLICCPVGTGGTLAGIAAGLAPLDPAALAAPLPQFRGNCSYGVGDSYDFRETAPSTVRGAPGAARSGAGAARGTPQALGFAVLKGAEFLNAEVARLQQQAWGHAFDNWRIELGSHFGGYAKRTPELDAFIAGFADRHGLLLDPSYTGKMLAGIFAMAARGEFRDGTRLVAVITG
jgi:1-aminocyclopropane-1-carboxylate deaminase